MPDLDKITVRIADVGVNLAVLGYRLCDELGSSTSPQLIARLDIRDADNSTMVSINAPTRIGHATAMPGDVVLGRNGGVIFIPPQLAEQVVKSSESTHLRDVFGHQRLEEKKYTAGEIDARRTPPIEEDYRAWLKQNEDHLPVPREQIEEILEEHQ